MRIAAIEAIPIREPEPEPGNDLTGWWVTTPMDVFLPPFHRPDGYRAPATASERITNVLVRVRTDDGLEGVAFVGVGSPAAVEVIRYHLSPLVLGASPFDVERLWELMFRTTINIGRKGLVVEAISAIDIALWDIMGKATGQPVYNLLGGRTRDRIRAYVSQSYASTDLERVHAEASSYVTQGFTALKMRLGYGPTDGTPGMRKNVELVSTVRDAVGPDVDVMVDVYMGWDATYAIAMIRQLEQFRLRWIEEPVQPDDLDGYARVRAAVTTPISGGEHESTKFGYRDMIEKKAVDILQPDVNRMGGITEARKVWALAAAHNLPVIPHSPQSHNAHLIMAHLNSPLIECFPRTGIRSGYTFFHELLEGEPDAVDGYISLSDEPGLGIKVVEEALERYRADGPGH